ncbi:MAG: aminoacetone oxidase family FAD-binding enzyme [Peptoniphilus harei]|uniref:aminoacetone oxidase family FAD-binding enzyme n=1 Tax=Peptoniphilus harei TaxID=54005 RepID=UPI00255154BE|nr:aminoacetone oxidase family FAD-binding enzyme [Peptoniphilus harei]MDK7755361.1 aminoacetone oxidase family FAD-binding enzyme [Peptoniphilus harei]MDK7761596.1 aminoacetone oxidase family FAD-binding enzyme [Peptoniphilus harei]MDK8271121.1 aminoacetone oxidase family FAD-binding enzyme [Peptoniphilus harei]MDK8339291.1 aminoacetone oxidase family FAD-binding enzyme [Peptoniphilus harei]
MDIIIIGAGASGIVTAINAKNENNRVILLEKNDRIGKKLLATGNGRCNYTNMNLSEKNYSSPDFVKRTLEDFSNEDLINYFRILGLESTLDGNRVYPISLKANSVLNILIYWLDKKGIEVKTKSQVKEIKKTKKGYEVITNEEILRADVVVAAFGGKAMPASGSDGVSFEILKKMGIRVTDLKPALTQLKLDSKYLKHLSGTKVIGRARLLRGEKVIDEREGEILFTNYGISGPPILDMSVNTEEGDVIEVPLINNLKKDSIDMVYNRYYMFPDFSLEEFLMGLVDKKFIHYIVDSLYMDKNTAMNMISMGDFEKIIGLLLRSRFKVTGNTGFKNAQVTRGGVSLDEVSPENYEAKKYKDLYIIGEALDIDGDCGGYNLHFAFGCGYRLGKILREKNLQK